jgi:hypothetical protein
MFADADNKVCHPSFRPSLAPFLVALSCRSSFHPSLLPVCLPTLSSFHPSGIVCLPSFVTFLPCFLPLQGAALGGRRGKIPPVRLPHSMGRSRWCFGRSQRISCVNTCPKLDFSFLVAISCYLHQPTTQAFLFYNAFSRPRSTCFLFCYNRSPECVCNAFLSCMFFFTGIPPMREHLPFHLLSSRSCV